MRETILEAVFAPLQDFARFVEDDRVVLHKLLAQKDHICSGMLQNPEMGLLSVEQANAKLHRSCQETNMFLA